MTGPNRTFTGDHFFGMDKPLRSQHILIHGFRYKQSQRALTFS